MTSQLELEFKERKTFHWANIATSERLQRVLKFMSDGQWHSTRDIIYGANVCAVNAAMPELKMNGYDYEIRRETDEETGLTICPYRLKVII